MIYFPNILRWLRLIVVEFFLLTEQLILCQKWSVYDYTNESNNEDVNGDTDNEDDEEEVDSGNELANSFLESENLSDEDDSANCYDGSGNENESFLSTLLSSTDHCG